MKRPQTPGSPAPGPAAAWRIRTAWLLAGLWLLAAAAGWWFFALRPLQAGNNGWAAFEGEPLVRAAATLLADPRHRGRPLVLHFRDPRCACNVYSSGAAIEIARRADTPTLSYAVNAPGAASALPLGWKSAGVAELPDDLARQLWPAIAASPAVALFDASGRLVYVGSYGATGDCGTDRIAPALALAGKTGAAAPGVFAGTVATGCFCDRTTGQLKTIKPSAPEKVA